MRPAHEIVRRAIDHSLVRVTAPDRDRGNATLTHDGQLRTFSPRVNRVIRIPSSMMAQSWMSSDFFKRDVVRADDIVDRQDHRLIGEDAAFEPLLPSLPGIDAGHRRRRHGVSATDTEGTFGGARRRLSPFPRKAPGTINGDFYTAISVAYIP